MLEITCADEQLEPFNSRYNSHFPDLLRIPKIPWTQPYSNLESTGRFTALYGI